MAESRLYNSLAAELDCASGKHVVYGLRLKPFCLLHSFQLSTFDNPLWCGNGGGTPEHLMIAAQICASDSIVTDFQTLENSFDENAELDKWQTYMRTCSARPMTKDRPSDIIGDLFFGPVELQIVVYLMRNLGMDERRAWTMPYGLAWWYFETDRDQQDGDSMILTEEEDAYLGELKSEEAIAQRNALQENSKWIISNIEDPKLRQELLNQAAMGLLSGNWKEVSNG